MSGAPKTGPGPVIWLVVGIPALTLIGGFLTLAIAMRAGDNDAVPDEVRSTAQVQDRDLAEDAAATRLGLRAELDLADGGHALRLRQTDGTPMPRGPLVLRFIHPARADLDLQLPLAPEGDGWRTQLPPIAPVDWHLELRDAAGQWRLVGRWPRTAASATLAPALGS